MGELAQTPQAQQASAAAQLKKLNDGHRAKGAQEGRAAERKELIERFGQAVFDQFNMLDAFEAKLRAGYEREEQKHGRHQRWLGFAIGVPAGMILACGAIFAMQGIIWDTATRSFREQAMTGAIISSQGEGERNEAYTNPGQDVTRRP